MNDIRVPNLELPDAPPLSVILGRSAAMQELMDTIRSVASTGIPVLVQGESGTGKELCVRLLHALGDHPPATLVKVSCPSIPHALLESELFGYEKGAFTGANTTRKGRVEQAHGGTLFLDEVGSLDLGMQAKLLQLLQDGTFSRVGGHEVRQIRTRLVSVANRNLREQVAEGSFRLDLLYRINAITLSVPSLRERAEDLPGLIDFFLQQNAHTFRVKPTPIPSDILQRLSRYSWPGNIRQLENMIRSYVLVGHQEVLIPDEREFEQGLSAEIDVSTPISLKDITRRATQDIERRAILKVLKANGWNRRKTAQWLKISYRSLLYKLQEMGSADIPQAPPPPPRKPPARPAANAGPRLLRQDREL